MCLEAVKLNETGAFPKYNNFYYEMIDFYVFIQVILVHSLDSALTRYCSIRVSLSVPLVVGLLPHGDLTDNSMFTLGVNENKIVVQELWRCCSLIYFLATSPWFLNICLKRKMLNLVFKITQ